MPLISEEGHKTLDELSSAKAVRPLAPTPGSAVQAVPASAPGAGANRPSMDMDGDVDSGPEGPLEDLADKLHPTPR